MEKHRAMKETKEILNLLVISAIVLLCFCAVATACPPACPPCYIWNGEGCDWNCSSGESCCGGYCYNTETSKCCDESTGHTCLKDRECCNASTKSESTCCATYMCDSCHYSEVVGWFCPTCNNDPCQDCCDGTCYDIETKDCCENLTIYNKATKKCCEDGLGNTCPKDDTCCDGDCCGGSTPQCCDDIGGDNDGYCCPSDKICCNGNCCESYQCCINGQCVDPICDNCHSVSETIYECGHVPNDPNGTPCATNWCIKDVLDSATCDHKGAGWPCTKSHCDTTDDYSVPGEVFQRAYNATCPGGTVTKDPEWILWSGCVGCGTHGYDSSCKVASCNESQPLGNGQWHGTKRKCGCP